MTKPALPPTLPCPRCGTPGALPNPARVGPDLRLVRKRAGIGLRELGRELGLSPSYLHDLECGKRGWTAALVNRYREAVIAIAKRNDPYPPEPMSG